MSAPPETWLDRDKPTKPDQWPDHIRETRILKDAKRRWYDPLNEWGYCIRARAGCRLWLKRHWTTLTSEARDDAQRAIENAEALASAEAFGQARDTLRTLLEACRSTPPSIPDPDAF